MSYEIITDSASNLTRDLLEKYDANTIRFFILTNHYRMPVEFNDEALLSAQNGFKRIKNAINEGLKFTGGKENLTENIESEELDKFKAGMDNDFNTSVALSVLFDLSGSVNQAIANKDKEKAIKYLSILYKLSDVLGFKIEKEKLSSEELKEKLNSVELDFIDDKNLDGYTLMEKIIEVRNSARAEKNWALSDKIRNVLDKIGIILKDTKEKTYWEEK